MNRRGFLGSLAALIAAPRALLARHRPTTVGLSHSASRVYSYKVTYTTTGGETLSSKAFETVPIIATDGARELYTAAPGDTYRLIGYAGPTDRQWTYLRDSH